MLLLAAVALVAVSALGAQLVRLSVFEHDAHEANVERHLVTRRLLPALRGSIVDRRGEVLATDRAAWDVLLSYDAITGRWSSERAREALVKEMGRANWLELSSAERVQRILARQVEFDAQLEQVYARLAEAGAIDRVELDRRLDAVIARAERELRSRKEALLARETRLYGEDARLGEIDRERVGAERAAHAVLPDVPDSVRFYFQRLAEELPGTVSVEPSMRRERPWERIEFEVPRRDFPTPIRSSKPIRITAEGVADHIVGALRMQVFAEDLARRPMNDPESGRVVDLGGYRSDRDAVGASGFERAAEDALRGTRGVVERNLETAGETRTEPVRGRDVQLTIDIRLQARIQAMLDPRVGLAKISQYQRGVDAEGNPRGGPLPLGWELDGSVVVLEVATGEILAAVSSPTLADGARMSPERRAQEHPEVFRPLEGLYPPGSILKPLVLCAAMAEGVLKPGESIECKGHFFADNQAAVRCHTFRPAEGRTGTHGPLEAPDALARSCNIYFYELARRLGPERFVAWMRRFGIEHALGTGLGVARQAQDGEPRIVGEAPGALPDAALLAQYRSDRDRVSPVLLGIGQGAITWTPLHAAHAYATIARGGRSVAPRLVRGFPEPPAVDLGIPSAAIRESLEGLRASVNESYGTGHHLTIDGERELLFDLPDLSVWGKTGTATASRFAIDGDRDGTAETRVQTDHAWFVGLVGERAGAPRYAVAVILEYGGSGGKVAGPVAAEVMRAIAAEGYLGDAAQRSAGRVDFGVDGRGGSS